MLKDFGTGNSLYTELVVSWAEITEAKRDNIRRLRLKEKTVSREMNVSLLIRYSNPGEVNVRYL
jgi:hypothetical protein